MDFIGLINVNKNIAAEIFVHLPLFDKMRLLMVNKIVSYIVLSKGIIWSHISLQKLECFTMNYNHLLLLRNHSLEDKDEKQIMELIKKTKQLELEKNKNSLYSLDSDNEVKKFLNYLIHLGLNKHVKALDLSNCFYHGDDKNLFWITKNFPNLEALSLAECGNAPGYPIGQVTQFEINPHLKILNMNGAYLDDIIDWLKQIVKYFPNLEQFYFSGINDTEYDREGVHLDDLKNLKNLKVLQMGDPQLNFDTVKPFLNIPTLEALYWNGVNISEKPENINYKIFEASVPFDIFPPNLQYTKSYITAPNYLIRGMNLLHLVLEKSTVPVESLRILVEEMHVDLNVPILNTDQNNYFTRENKVIINGNMLQAKYTPYINGLVPWYPYYKEPIDYRGLRDNNNNAKNGFFPIHLATLSGNEDVISYLVKNGADVNAGVLETGVTPLMFACLMKDYQLIKLLLSLGSDIKIIDTKNKWNAGFYLLAKSKGNDKELDCMKLLLKAGLDLSWKSEDTKLTVFSFCASQGNLHVLEFLLDNGVGLETCGPDLINFAVSKLNKIDERKQKELIHFVTQKLQKIGKLTLKPQETDSPLTIAAITGNESLIYYLLEETENKFFATMINHLDSYGKSALHYICLNIGKFTDGLKLVQKMIDCGADIFLKDNILGATPFLMACLVKIGQQQQQQNNYRRYERYEIGYNTDRNAELAFKLVSLLLENTDPSRRKELVNTGDKRGFTPLHSACFLTIPSFVSFLIENGAEPNATDEMGQTPAIVLARVLTNNNNDNRYDRNVDKTLIYKFEEVLQILKNAGANFEHVDKRSKTALLYVSSTSFAEPEWVDVMGITSPQQLNHQDNKGRTPLLKCIQNTNIHLAVGLVKRGADINFVNKCGATPLFYSMILQAFNLSRNLFCPVKNNSNRKYWEYPFESNLSSLIYPISWYKSTKPKAKNSSWSPPRFYSSKDLILYFLENSNITSETNNFLGTSILMLSSMVDSQYPKTFEKAIKIFSEKLEVKELANKVDIFGSNVCHYTSRQPSYYFTELSKNAQSVRQMGYTDKVSYKLLAKTFIVSVEKAGGNPNALNNSSHNAFFTMAMVNGGGVILNNIFKMSPNIIIENINHQDFDGNTLAMKVLLNNFTRVHTSEKLLLKLLERGADFSIKNKSGETPFMLACREGMFTLVYQILQKFPTFDVNQSNLMGNNVLNYLLVSSPWDGVDYRVIWKMFQNAGANFNTIDEFYRSQILKDLEGYQLPTNLAEIFKEMSENYLKNKKNDQGFVRDRRFVEHRNDTDNVIHKLSETLEEEWIFTVLPDQEKNPNNQVVCRICRRNGHREMNCPYY